MRVPSPLSVSVVDSIMSAYMACNAAGSPLEWEATPGISPNPTAMGHLAEAGRIAFTQLGLPADLWSRMVECGEDAAYVVDLYFDEEEAMRALDDDASAYMDRCHD